jgi:hypothetical protein
MDSTGNVDKTMYRKEPSANYYYYKKEKKKEM